MSDVCCNFTSQHFLFLRNKRAATPPPSLPPALSALLLRLIQAGLRSARELSSHAALLLSYGFENHFHTFGIHVWQFYFSATWQSGPQTKEPDLRVLKTLYLTMLHVGAEVPCCTPARMQGCVQTWVPLIKICKSLWMCSMRVNLKW